MSPKKMAVVLIAINVAALGVIIWAATQRSTVTPSSSSAPASTSRTPVPAPEAIVGSPKAEDPKTSGPMAGRPNAVKPRPTPRREAPIQSPPNRPTPERPSLPVNAPQAQPQQAMPTMTEEDLLLLIRDARDAFQKGDPASKTMLDTLKQQPDEWVQKYIEMEVAETKDPQQHAILNDMLKKLFTRYSR
ncbi:MAG: hypothetical protein HY716_10780 [Planctomycetes bacterium]|nr:hypothetical protein [Planctomycetota bacterium]